MVAQQVQGRGVRDARVLKAMREIPRHEFVPPDQRTRAYADMPLPIGHGQTISQPYIVAFMTEMLEISPQDRILEIGTGSGYQTAVLASLAKQVFSVEWHEALAMHAQALLKRLGFHDVQIRAGDGREGWAEHAPFDKIMLTAAPEEIPQALTEQLAMGGKLVAPVGALQQELIEMVRTPRGLISKTSLPVRFVPLL